MKVLLTILILLLSPMFALADSTTIINNVSVSASTGARQNFSSENLSGQGNSYSEVKIYTEVNGEVIEDFKKEIQGAGEINYEAEKKFEGGKVETKVEVNTETTEAEAEMSRLNLDIQADEITSSLEAEVSKSDFDTLKTFEVFRAKVKQIFKYVFSFFKFK